MRTSRTALVIILSMILLATASLPALAADQFIRYKGTTSAASPNHVHVGVLKRDNVRRLNYIVFNLTLTCEDSSTREREVILRYRRLDENGDFSAEVPRVVKGTYLRVDGSIGWAEGTGTVLFNSAKLTEDGSAAQLCTTGELTWTVDRGGAHPYRPNKADGGTSSRCAAPKGSNPRPCGP